MAMWEYRHCLGQTNTQSLVPKNYSGIPPWPPRAALKQKGDFVGLPTPRQGDWRPLAPPPQSLRSQKS